MIQAIVRLYLAREKRTEAQGIICSISERVRAKRGCIGCDVYQNTRKEEILVYEELWESKEDMERHLRSDDYHKLLLVIEMSSHPPDISFNTIQETAGLETIERARQESICRKESK